MDYASYYAFFERMRKRYIALAVAAGSTLLTGCLGPASPTYVPAVAGPTVPLIIQMEEGGNAKDTFFGEALAFVDETCKSVYPRKDRLGLHAYVKPGDGFPTASIPVGHPFTFSVSKMKTSGFTSHGCSFTATFVPVADRKYLARFKSHTENGTCTIRVTDQDNHSVPIVEPGMSCAYTAAGRVVNGKSWLDRTTIRFSR